MFDEKRVFTPGPMPGPFNIRGVRIGVPICEDIWTPDVVECLAETGGEILLVPNGSPFEAGKEDVRLNLVAARVTEAGMPLIYLNQVGGQDELVFDGASLVANADRSLAWALPAWEEKVAITDWRRDGDNWVCAPGERWAGEERSQSVYHAMMLGLRDYVNKNRFPGVVLGLSGGIDSALSAAVAVDALGADRVRCVMLPSRYTVAGKPRRCRRPARSCWACLMRPSRSSVRSPRSARRWRRPSPARAPDTTEENIQSRIRGVILMAISNKFGPMVLTTGNKSEMSVGYATLYGDMCGGYNVLKDVYKMEVFALARWRNQHAAERRAWARKAASFPRTSSHAAHRGVARRPDRSGFAAALRHPRRHSRMPGGAGDVVRRRGARRAMIRRPSSASSTCFTSPNISAARRRRA